jgi:hypothetical protein
MNFAKSLAVAVILVTALYVGVSEGSAGVKDYGDSCSLVSSFVQVVEVLGEGDRQYQGACDVSKGLVCLGKCTCAVGEYQQNVFEQIFGGGRCSSKNGGAQIKVGVGSMLTVLVPALFYFFQQY